MNNLYFPETIEPISLLKERNDRTNNQLRRIFLDIGLITQASGSAYIEMGNTKVICGVYGPKSIASRRDAYFSETGQLLCDFKFAPFARLDEIKERKQGDDEKELSLMLQEALESSIQLEKMPKSMIQVFIIVLEANGGEFAAAVTCASLALAHAGIELFGLVSGCSVGIKENSKVVEKKTQDNGNDDSQLVYLLDPSTAEEIECSARVTVTMMGASREITHLFQQGVLDFKETGSAIGVCIEGCSQIFALMRQTLINHCNEIANRKRNEN